MSEVRDKVSFWLVLKAGREPSKQGERDERRSAGRSAGGETRLLTARTPPGVADLPDFERSASKLSVGLEVEDRQLIKNQTD